MTSFTTPIRGDIQNDGSITLTEPFIFYYDYDRQGNIVWNFEDTSKGEFRYKIEAPVGFNSNGASVPFPFNILLPKWGDYGKAVVLHDLLYNVFIRMHHGTGCTRGSADRFLLLGCKILKVPAWQSYALYTGVRIGGWYYWNKYKEKRSKLI